MYSFRERWAALDATAALLARQSPPPPADAVAGYFRVFLGLVSGARLVITPDPITYEQGNPSLAQATRFIGGKVQLTDTQQVTARRTAGRLVRASPRRTP